MERPKHIAQSLYSLKLTKRDETVTVCEGRVQNGSEFVDRVAALSTGLRKLGLQTGGRVAIAGLNSDRYLEWLLAVPSAGGIIAPLNHRWSVEEASEAIREIEANVLVVDDHCMGWCKVLKSTCPSLFWIVDINAEGLENPNTLIDGESIIQLAGVEPKLELLHSPNSIALICFTSGTTGRPKGVALSHDALIMQSLGKIKVVGYSYKDVYLHTATMGHIGGISSALATVMANGCHIILPKFQPADVYDFIDKYKVSTMIVVPAMVNDLISYWNNAVRGCNGLESSKSFPTVTTILNGAGGLSLCQLEVMKRIFPASRIMSAYGMTEACSSMTFLLVHDPQPSFGKVRPFKEEIASWLQKDSEWGHTFHLGGACVGKPAPDVEILINSPKEEESEKYMDAVSNLMNINTKAGNAHLNNMIHRIPSVSPLLPRNISAYDKSTPGEKQFRAGNVLTRGAHVMDGYWGQPVLSRKTLLGGWLDTGDVGWMDEFGQLWLLGRQKDVIKSGGENVHASEVEGVLEKHPAVLAAAVVGVPDNRLEEAVAAVVRLQKQWRWEYGEAAKEGYLARVITETLLRAHCQQHGLSRYKVPKFIIMQEEPFPVTSTGKVKKEQVQSLVVSQLEARGVPTEGTSTLSKFSDPKILHSRL